MGVSTPFSNDSADQPPLATGPDVLRLHWRAMKYGWGRNRAEIRMVRGLVSAGDTVVDAGAHKGAYTWWLRRFVGPAGRVAAFEPQSGLASRLAGCARRLGWDSVRVTACAVSDAVGEGRLVVEGSNSPGARLNPLAAAGEGLAVPLTTLDAWFAECGWPAPSFIKADCEGHEPEVLRGAGGLLKSSRPVLLLELEYRHLGAGRFREVLGFLRKLGYRGWFFSGGRLFPIEEFRRESHQCESEGDYWKSPGYCNNFLFRS